METATKRNRILSPSIRIGIRSDLARGKRQGLLQEWGWAAELSTRRNWDNQNLMNNTIVAFARPLNQSLFLLSGFYWFLGCKNYFIISISFLLCLAKSAFNFTLANICRDNSRVPPEIIICVDKSLIETASSSVWTWQFFLNTNRLAKLLFFNPPTNTPLGKNPIHLRREYHHVTKYIFTTNTDNANFGDDNKMQSPKECCAYQQLPHLLLFIQHWTTDWLAATD